MTEAVAEIAEARASIEQAKGMLMVVYRIDADTAFDLLAGAPRSATSSSGGSRNSSSRISAASNAARPPSRETYDGLFMTVHLRVKS